MKLRNAYLARPSAVRTTLKSTFSRLLLTAASVAIAGQAEAAHFELRETVDLRTTGLDINPWASETQQPLASGLVTLAAGDTFRMIVNFAPGQTMIIRDRVPGDNAEQFWLNLLAREEDPPQDFGSDQCLLFHASGTLDFIGLKGNPGTQLPLREDNQLFGCVGVGNLFTSLDLVKEPGEIEFTGFEVTGRIDEYVDESQESYRFDRLFFVVLADQIEIGSVDIPEPGLLDLFALMSLGLVAAGMKRPDAAGRTLRRARR